jgi:hypothetical protein
MNGPREVRPVTAGILELLFIPVFLAIPVTVGILVFQDIPE